MRIIRFVDEWGQPRTGAAEGDSPRPRRARLICGDLFREWGLDRQMARVTRLLAPLEPPLVVAVGLNYRQHAAETGARLPEQPLLFLKAPGCVVGPGADIVLPAAGPDEVDYEGELAVIIGRPARDVSADRAPDYVLGYACANDVSARDWQLRRQGRQWARGKSFDTFCPLGPWLVTADEIPDPGALPIRTELNGRVMQDSSTADMIFPVAELVADLSRSLTLPAGTVILTGTPAGIGFTRQPPVFLRPGDRVSVTIGGIGTLENGVRTEA